MECRFPKDGSLLALLLFLLLHPYTFGAPIPTVRILVERSSRSLEVSGFDVLVADAATTKSLVHENFKAQIRLECSLGNKIRIESNSKVVEHNGPLHIESLGGFLRVDDKQYREDLYVYSFNKDCIVVNHVDLEKYVAGVLNSEMNAKWNLQTLMAQAVAARTYAVFQMKEAGTTRWKGLRNPFDLNSTVRDQVYEGASKERYRAIKAVEQTRGMVLSFDGQPIKAFYHSTCGGYTESPGKVWGKSLPYMKSVHCGFCQKSPRYNWDYEINSDALSLILKKEGLLKGKLLYLNVLNRNGIGRAHDVEIKGDLGSTIVRATKIRDLFGATKVMSTDFHILKDGSRFIFDGHGSGHGVGMCQYGAKAMGDQGYDYRKILSRYYPQAQLTRLY